jgi:hypothetical protein
MERWMLKRFFIASLLLTGLCASRCLAQHDERQSESDTITVNPSLPPFIIVTTWGQHMDD